MKNYKISVYWCRYFGILKRYILIVIDIFMIDLKKDHYWNFILLFASLMEKCES